MGAALWKLAADEAEEVEAPAELAAGIPVEVKRYRIETLGRPRTPWRDSEAEAMADAKALDLASWDAAKREHFLAVPVEMKVERLGAALF